MSARPIDPGPPRVATAAEALEAYQLAGHQASALLHCIALAFESKQGAPHEELPDMFRAIEGVQSLLDRTRDVYGDASAGVMP